jgi:hypothetical protein
VPLIPSPFDDKIKKALDAIQAAEVDEVKPPPEAKSAVGP